MKIIKTPAPINRVFELETIPVEVKDMPVFLVFEDAQDLQRHINNLQNLQNNYRGWPTRKRVYFLFNGLNTVEREQLLTLLQDHEDKTNTEG